MLRNISRAIITVVAPYKRNTLPLSDAQELGSKADGCCRMLLMHQTRAMSAEAEKPKQTKSLFVMNVEGKRTTGPLLIGLMDYFQRWLPNVGYFEVCNLEGPLAYVTGDPAPAQFHLHKGND